MKVTLSPFLSPEQILSAPFPIGTCLSLYVPTLGTTPIGKPEHTILKNEIRKAQSLLERDLSRSEVDEFLEPVKRLNQENGWAPGRGSLAVFHSKAVSGYFKIPLFVEPITVVSGSFHVKPLLQWRMSRQRFWLLTLTARTAQLYLGSEAELETVQSWSSDKPATRNPNSYFNQSGHGGAPAADNNEKKTADPFYEQVREGVYALLANEITPLLLAGASDACGRFQSIYGHRNIYETKIEGKWELAQVRELHARALEVLAPRLELQIVQALEDFQQARSERRAAWGVEEVAKAAVAGRVQRLFIAQDCHVWGNMDQESGLVRIKLAQENSGDDDLLDELAETTMRNRGKICVLPSDRMPLAAKAAATLRW